MPASRWLRLQMIDPAMSRTAGPPRS